MRIRFYLVIVLVFLTRVADAQSVAKMLEEDLSHAGKDMLAVWLSPFDSKGRDWITFAAAVGVTGVSLLADQEVADWAARNDSSGFFKALKPIRRNGKLYTGKYVVPPIAALWIVGLATKNQAIRDAVMGCASSWLSQSAARKAFYLLVGRARPDTMPDNPNHWTIPGHNEWQMHSMPAGHFGNVMACASFWNNRFRMGFAEPLIYAFAGAVAIGRIADEGHWFSDHIAGGIFGYAVGREVANRSLRRARGLPHAPVFGISPTPNGVSASFSWTF
jgi:membrane-associated phospholipid phosphatase